MTHEEITLLHNRIATAEREVERLREENEKWRLGMQENCSLRARVEALEAALEALEEWVERIEGDERVCGWVHKMDYGLYCLLVDPPVNIRTLLDGEEK